MLKRKIAQMVMREDMLKLEEALSRLDYLKEEARLELQLDLEAMQDLK